jgi:hypothetical protein
MSTTHMGIRIRYEGEKHESVHLVGFSLVLFALIVSASSTEPMCLQDEHNTMPLAVFLGVKIEHIIRTYLYPIFQESDNIHYRFRL